jgi:hypothetical protein
LEVQEEIRALELGVKEGEEKEEEKKEEIVFYVKIC